MKQRTFDRLFRIVGFTEWNGKAVPLVHGEIAFRMLDSEGLPLGLFLKKLTQHHLLLHWPSFIDAAFASGNYSAEKILQEIREAALIEFGQCAIAPELEAYVQQVANQA